MKEIALPIAELKPALTGLGKVISKRCTLPVLNHVKIERTAEGWLAITATDLDTFVTVRLEQPSAGEPLALLVPFEQLQRTAKACTKNEDIFVAPGAKNTGFIQYGLGTQLAEIEFDALPVDEFPSTPRMKGVPIPLNNTLRMAIHDALECASTDETRMILNGAFLDTTKPQAHYVVGMDGRHLFTSNSFSLPMKDSLIIPSHKFVGWKEFNNDGEWQLRVAPPQTKDDPSYLQISSRRWHFITKQIEGQYPNWRHSVPDSKTVTTTLTLDPQMLKGIIDTIARIPCHNAVHFTIGLEWKNGNLYLLGKAPNASEWMRVPVEAQGMGSEITIFLNRHYLTKALGFGLNTVELSDPTGYLRFFEGGRQMVVVPLRPDVGNPPPTTNKPEEPEEPENAKAEAPQPAATPPAAQPQERTTMPATNTNGNGTHQEPADKPTLEKALEQIESVKGSYRAAIRGLNDLTETLKFIHKEQKSTEKEVQSVRTTLEKLQSVRL